MRLLELRGSSTSAESKPAALLQKSVNKLAAGENLLKRPVTVRVSPAAARVFPINSRPVPAAQIRRKPDIDLEQLQQRIELLEQRIQARLDKPGDRAGREALELLHQRMKLLERKLETELWAAKQREYALLEMLAKPSGSVVLKQRLLRLLRSIPAAVWRWLKAAGKEWWLDSQPLWWPRLSAAWQEAMYRARH